MVLCDQKMQDASEDEVEKEYQKILTAAQKNFDEENYERAIELYERAKGIRPSDPVPQQKIDEINKILADLAAAKEVQAKYDAAIAQADKLFGEENYKDAKSAYQAALDIKSDEQYPKDQMVLCDQKMQDESANEVEREYQKILTAAQKNFDEKNYERAIELYERAKGIRPSDPLPQQKIDEINKILADLEANKELQAKYDAAIAKADKLFTEGNFKEAKVGYQDAIDIMDKPYPHDQINLCDEKMQAESMDEEEAQYQKILKVAQKKFDEKNYEKALELYERAKSIHPADPLPQQRIDEINQLLKDQAAEKEKRDRFDALIQQADTYFERKEWKRALAKYLDALDLYVEQYPQDQVEKCREGLKGSGDTANKEYNKLIKKADEYFNAKNYEKAKNLYTRAIKIKPSDKYPKDQLKEIDRILNPPKKMVANSGNLKDYGPQTNNRSIDIEAMMKEAEEASRYFEYQKIFKKREDAESALAEFAEAGDEESYKTKSHAESLEEDITEAQELSDIGRQDARDNTDEWREELAVEKTERDMIHENDIHYQETKLEALETEILESEYDNDKPREQYLLDVEKIKLEVKNENRNNAIDQNDVTMDDKEDINTMVENHVVRDANNDLARKNTEVEVEDFHVRVINKNNEDTWSQEDEMMKTKDGTEYMVDDIAANNLGADIPRTENIEIVENINISYEDRELNNSDEQRDNTHEVIDNTEVMKDEFRENAEGKDDTREEYEAEVEKINISYEDRELTNSIEQNDNNHEVKAGTEQMTDEFSENIEDKDDVREKYEETVEEINISYEDRELENADDQNDKNHRIKDNTEVMKDEFRENAEGKDDTREEYEVTVEEINLSYEDRELKNSDDQNDKNHKVKDGTEQMTDEFRDNIEDKDDVREKYEETVEEINLSYEDRELTNSDNQTDENLESKEHVEQMQTDASDHYNEMDKDREGYEEKVEKVTEDISEYNGNLEDENTDKGYDVKDYTEEMTNDQEETSIEMDENADKQADKVGDQIEGHIEIINDKEEENSEAQDDNQEYVETLKDIKVNEITPEIENELGQKYPEGVTEESYQIDDNNGLMKAYVIRRVVVREGAGTVYEKIQTRYGHESYTRNGQPITEYQWSDETSASQLTRN
jgi:hypothetical protein